MTLLGRGSQCINSGGEKIYPEEVESALKAPPQGVRRARRRRRRRAVGPDGRRRRRSPGRARCPRSTSWPSTAAPASPATRCRGSCTSSTRCPASRAASPTTRGPRRSPSTQEDDVMNERADRDVRDRVPDLRLLPLPRRGRRGHQRRRHGRARRAGVLARAARARAQLDRRARQRPALRRRRGDAGQDGRPRRRPRRRERHRRAAPRDDPARSTGTTSTRSSPTTASTCADSAELEAGAGIGAGVLGWTEATGAPQIEIALLAPHRPAGQRARPAAEGGHRPGPRAGRARSPRSSGGSSRPCATSQHGVDIIIAQGYEAGGHTGEVATMVLIPDVVDAIAPVPVLGAGGIGSGRQMAAAMALGAAGVWTGSIWLTVAENDVVGRRHREAARRHLDRHRALAGLHRQAGPPAAHGVDRGLGGAGVARHAADAAAVHPQLLRQPEDGLEAAARSSSACRSGRSSAA